MSRTVLRVCTFKGSQNLALYVACRQGFFAARGLEVEIIYTTGSAPQIAGLVRGDYHLVQTAPDNVVNANRNPAAFGLDPATPPRLTMLMGGSIGPLCLCAQPGVVTFADLRGTVLGVDNPTSGFALVLHDMLARHGLHNGIDYTDAVAGATSKRLEALQSGAVAATILYAPYSTLAEEAGFHTLASSTEYYAAYASLATAGRAAWVETHSREVTCAIAAVQQALRWIYDPAHAVAAQDILQKELAVDAAMAAATYTAFVDPVTGFGEQAALSEAGLRQVMALRAADGNPPGPLDRLEAHLNLRWYREAMMQRSQTSGS